jgi:hypothetical protein
LFRSNHPRITRINNGWLNDRKPFSKSTYFYSISTKINNRPNMLWEQRVGGSNRSAPTNVIHCFH